MKKLSLLVVLVLTATLQSFAQDTPTKVKITMSLILWNGTLAIL